MSQEIIKVLEYLSDKLGLAIDWTQTNMMPTAIDVMHRYAGYQKTLSLIVLAVGVVLILYPILFWVWMRHCKCRCLATKETCGLYYYYNGSRYPDTGYVDEAEIFIPVALITQVIAVCLGLWFCFDSIKNFCAWTYVPEMQIITMLQGMMK